MCSIKVGGWHCPSLETLLDALYPPPLFSYCWNAISNKTTIFVFKFLLATELWKVFRVSWWRIFKDLSESVFWIFFIPCSYFLSGFYCLLNLAPKPTGQKIGIKNSGMSTASAALVALPLQSEWEILQGKAVMKRYTMAKKILCRSYRHLGQMVNSLCEEECTHSEKKVHSKL